MQCGIVGDGVPLAITEGDVSQFEGLGELLGRVGGERIFTNAKEVVEGNVDQASHCSLFGGAAWGLASFVEEMFSQCDWHGELWQGWWVFAAVAF